MVRFAAALDNLGTSTAFAIPLVAVEKKTKTDCRTRKTSKQRTKAAEQLFLLFTAGVQKAGRRPQVAKGQEILPQPCNAPRNVYGGNSAILRR